MTYPTKAEATRERGVQAAIGSIKQVHFSPKSTIAEAQRQRILNRLRVGAKATYDLRRIGIYQAPTRIIELRRSGYEIRTEIVTLWDRDGYVHPRCALYTLASEPEVQS